MQSEIHTDQWEKVKELFERTLKLPFEERSVFLRQVVSDPLLREEVEQLIESYEESGDFLEGQTNLTDHLLTPEETEKLAELPVLPAGYHIGHYKIVSEIGSGGMGTVYLGIRDDEEYQSKVAIKIVRRGMDTRFVIRRFLYERQILANLNHPNISMLLDGGTSSDGLPYFIMEYIEGIPIDDYCNRQNLTIRQRLKLFLKVCKAVSYAHQHTIVHRDLKASNILVTKNGEPKLLDFGIAKILRPELAVDPFGHIDKTASFLRLMTPECASPEQVLGKEITTGTDVYSLGFLLYELLSGHSPYKLEKNTEEALRQAICEQEPVPPSSIFAATRKSMETENPIVNYELLSRNFSSGRETIYRILSGDLDNIILKALHKEPERRYISVVDLTDDINRYLNNRPVLARPDNFTYRTVKFIGRHKTALLIILIGLILITLFFINNIQQSAQLARERDKARAVTSFLTDIFSVSDPYRYNGDPLTVRQILDQGAERISGELKDQPEVQASLMYTIGEVYSNLGIFDRAIDLMNSSLSRRRQILGNLHQDTAESLYGLGRVYGRSYEYSKSEACFSEALQIERQLNGVENERYARILNDYGSILFHKGDTEAAEQALQEALRIRKKLLGNENPEVAETLNNLGELFRGRGDLKGAEQKYVEAWQLRQKSLGENHPVTAESLQNLAWLNYEENKDSLAESQFRQVITIRRKAFPNGHPELANTLIGLGLLLTRTNRAIEAEPLLREAVSIRRKLLPLSSWETGYAESDLGACLSALGKYKEAEPLLLNGYQVYKEHEGDQSPKTIEAINRIIALYRASNQTDKVKYYKTLLMLEK